MSVVTAQQAALAANFAKAVSVLDRVEQCAAIILDKRVSGVASLLRHLKQVVKQLELWQSAAAVTASQLLAAADLADSAGCHEPDDCRLIDVAVSVSNCCALPVARPPACTIDLAAAASSVKSLRVVAAVGGLSVKLVTV